MRHSDLLLIDCAENENVKKIDVREGNRGEVKPRQHVNEDTIKVGQPSRWVGFTYLPHRTEQKKLRQNI